MRSNLKLVVNNPHNKIEEKHFFEKDELKIILDLYAKMVSEGSWKDYGLSISHPTSVSRIDLPIIFFRIGSLVKYFPKNNARANIILMIVGFT